MPRIKKESLCWMCEKSLPGSGCSWSNNFEPVDSWVATSKKIDNNGSCFADTYHVIECPLFELSEKLKWKDCGHCIKFYKCVKKQFGVCSDFDKRVDRDRSVIIG